MSDDRKSGSTLPEHPPEIDTDELATLAARMNRGDPAALQALWEHVGGLVTQIAYSLHNQGQALQADVDDLIQEGNLAVGKVLPRWDPDKGTLGTWAGSHARWAMLDYARDHGNTSGGMKASPKNRPYVQCEADLAGAGQDWVPGSAGERFEVLFAGTTRSKQPWATPEGYYVDFDELPLLRAELESRMVVLSPREDYYVRAVFFEDCPLAELARDEGITNQAVSKILRRAVDKLNAEYVQ